MITILHADDRLLVEELSGTTESEGSTGNVRYYPPVKDRDHRTDSLRACARAILSLESSETGYDEFSSDSEVGWMEFEDGGFNDREFSWAGSF